MVLHTRFRNEMYGELILELKNLKLEGMLSNYFRSFDALLNKVQMVEKLTKSSVMSFFVRGLSSTLLDLVRLLRPKSLHEAYALAKLHEAVIKTQSRPIYIENRSTPTLTTRGSIAAGPGNSRGITNGRTTKTMTSKETENRRSKGLCYWCLKKFMVGHRCIGRQLLLIEVEEEEEDNEVLPVVVETDEEVTVKEAPQISIHAIGGMLYCSTMKIEGAVNNKRLQILIDSGSTHNFLDTKMVERLGCCSEDINVLKVIVVNENVMHCSKVYRELCWSMQGKELVTVVLLIPLENYHKFSRGTITFEYEKYCVEFHRSYYGFQVGE